MEELEQHHRRLERAYASAPTNKYFRPEITIAEGRATVKIPLRNDFFHTGNAVHGSVYFKALDDASFFAAASLVEDAFWVTSSFNLYFLRPVSDGEIRAEGRVVHRSKRLMVGEAELFDGDGRLIARGSGTFLSSNIPLDEKVGYR